MIKIEFPKNVLKINHNEGTDEIFDEIRKKWLVLTPEEWVRQNILQYLLIEKKYPASLIAIEKEIKLGELKKRCDIVIYNRNAQPWMIIECKEMKVPLTQKTLEQLLRYHLALPVPYLIITNGSFTFGFEKVNQEFIAIAVFPEYEPA